MAPTESSEAIPKLTMVFFIESVFDKSSAITNAFETISGIEAF